MNPDMLFTRAVRALPKEVRKRLDGDTPIDWARLEQPGSRPGLGDAAPSDARLPRPVETLLHRLVADVGVVPDDLAAGASRQGAAGAWDQGALIEADGDSYRIRSHAGGVFHSGIRAEAVAGYVTLALELAAAVHEAAERWIEAGARHRDAAGEASGPLALCAERMGAALRADPETGGPVPTTAGTARILDDAWNGQSLKSRAALAALGLRAARGACAPRRAYYAPTTGYRLHAYDPGEIRWLLALAEHAAATDEAGAAAGSNSTAKGTDEAIDAPARSTNGAVRKRAPEAVVEKPPAAAATRAPDATNARGARGARDATDTADATDTDALEARIQAASLKSTALLLGSHPEALIADRELDELVLAANRLSEAVRRRLRDTYGIEFSQALARIRNHEEGHAVIADIKAEMSETRAPRWLEDLAATLLMDAGALTRDGMRTESARLDALGDGDDAEGGYRIVEVETGAIGQLTPVGLVEQVRLGLTFALDTWRGYTAFRGAGKESGWILDKGKAEESDFSAGDQTTLEAARRMGQVLGHIQRASGKQVLTALEEASITANAFRGVGAATRGAAGWRDPDEAPNPHDPEHVLRIAGVAEALHDDIRAIANKCIASWIADAKAYRERDDKLVSALRGNKSAPRRDKTAPDDDANGESRHEAAPRTTRTFDHAREWRQP